MFEVKLQPQCVHRVFVVGCGLWEIDRKLNVE